jgi:two-component system, OmpR family, KDP operon response regulator KdpE
VLTAASMEEALGVVALSPVDAAIIDLVLPDGDGMELCRRCRDGEEIRLTRTEFELLSVLLRNRGRMLTHRAPLSEVWGPGYADDTQVLRTHIARLRRKIEPPGAARGHYLRTEPGVGFRFDPR